MQVYFSKHANLRCKERNLDKDYLRKVILEAPKCVGTMRVKVDDKNTYAVIHDIEGIRHVITIYEGGFKFDNVGFRPGRKSQRERRKRDNRLRDFREW